MNKSPWLKTDETLRDGDRTREREFRVKTNELRSLFLEYFREKGHLLIPSSSLVPYRDPSVLLQHRRIPVRDKRGTRDEKVTLLSEILQKQAAQFISLHAEFPLPSTVTIT